MDSMGLSCGLENITVTIYFDVQFGHQAPLQPVCSVTGALGAFNKKTNWNSVIFQASLVLSFLWPWNELFFQGSLFHLRGEFYLDVKACA